MAKDESGFDDKIEITFDGKEFLITKADLDNILYGKKVYPVDNSTLVSDLFFRNNGQINGVTLGDLMKNKNYDDYI